MKTISVTEPFSQAMSRVRVVLFQPFDLGKWFAIGFCAWLALLAEPGGFTGGNFGGGHKNGPGEIRQAVDQAREFIVNNLSWLAPLVIALAVVGLIIGIALLWVSSRGKFMFLHNIAQNSSEVAVPWEAFAREAQSLFFFRLLLSIVSFILFLPMIAGLVVISLRMVYSHGHSFTPGGVIAIIVLVLGLVFLGIVFWVIGRLLEDFVVPIQYARRARCGEAWGELRKLSAGNIGNLVLYLLFRIVLAIGISAVVFVAVIATCCILGCFLLIPYLGTVLLLPVLVLERAYSLYYLAQYGPEFECFTPPPASAQAA